MGALVRKQMFHLRVRLYSHDMTKALIAAISLLHSPLRANSVIKQF